MKFISRLSRSPSHPAGISKLDVAELTAGPECFDSRQFHPRQPPVACFSFFRSSYFIRPRVTIRAYTVRRRDEKGRELKVPIPGYVPNSGYSCCFVLLKYEHSSFQRRIHVR